MLDRMRARTPVRRAAALAREGVFAAEAAALYSAGLSDRISERMSAPRGHRPEYSARTLPVYLPHGIWHNQSWSWKIERELTEVGFICRSVNYSTVGNSVAQAAAEITAHIRDLAARHDVPAVHVVAHSLGGILVRHALTSGDLDGLVATVVTLGTPHTGTPLAHPVFHRLPLVGALVAEIHPGSALITGLNEHGDPGGAQWRALYSPDDEVVRGRHGRLDAPQYAATNTALPGLGHMGLMFDNRSVEAVLRTLVAADDDALSAQVARWSADQQSPALGPVRGGRP
jgi:hypothetical protein